MAETSSPIEGAQMTVPQDRPADRPAESVAVRTLRDTGYALSGFPLTLAGFVVIITGVATGLGTVIIWVGLPILVATVLVARVLAQLERGRLQWLQGRPGPTLRYLRPDPSAGTVRRMLAPLRDPQSWLDVAWSLLGWVVATYSFVLVVVWWSVMLGGLSYRVWQRWLPHGRDDGLGWLLGIPSGGWQESLLYIGLGALALATLPIAARAAVLPQAGLAAALLNSRPTLAGELDRAVHSRSAARVAEADSLRRLERDLHDGPQQRLVRLTMDLGRARKQLADDPERAASTLDAALQQARDTVEELRALSRGIAPPLLVDRGLTVAIRELVDRSEIPVRLRCTPPETLPPHIETAVYFTVAEALTNVAKHSGAGEVSVEVVEALLCEPGLLITITDDGAGGAHLAKGSGLSGLRQRLAGVEGTLDVFSPAGEGTTVRAWIPLQGNR